MNPEFDAIARRSRFTDHELDLLVGSHCQLSMFSAIVGQNPNIQAQTAARDASACAFAIQQITHPCSAGAHMVGLTKQQIAALLRSVTAKAKAFGEQPPAVSGYAERLAAVFEKAAMLVENGTIPVPCECASPQERLELAARESRPQSSSIVLPGDPPKREGFLPGGVIHRAELD